MGHHEEGSTYLTDMQGAAIKAISESLEGIREHGHLASAHEGYAVLQEEVDELWDEIKLKGVLVDPGAIWEEAIQVAAVALRIAVQFGEDSG